LARLKVLQTRDQVISQLFQDARSRLAQISNNAEKYKPLLCSLILQGLFQLMEKEVIVVCRKKDSAIVQSVVVEAAQKYEQQFKSPVKMVLETKEFLPDDCSGGVALSSVGGRIRCTNTLDSRLEMLAQIMLPEVRNDLFGKNENRKFFN